MIFDLDRIIDDLKNDVEIEDNELEFLFDCLDVDDRISLYGRYLSDNNYNLFYDIGLLSEFVSRDTLDFVKCNCDILDRFDYFYVSDLDCMDFDFVTESVVLCDAMSHVDDMYDWIVGFCCGDLVL